MNGGEAAPLRGVLFDATGTLIETAEPVGEVYRRVALEHGVDLPAWRLDDAFRRVIARAPVRGTQGESASARREHEVEWWFEVIRQTFQATDSTARFDDFRGFAGALFDAYRTRDAWRLRPGVRPCLERFEAADWPMAIVSNFDHRLPEILHLLEIDHYFESIELPSDHGVAKPEAPLFAAAAGALDLPFSQLAYVGDDALEDHLAVLELGLARTLDARAHPDPAEWPTRLGLPD